MSRAEREKGKRGEREVAKLLAAYGFEARRDGRLDDDLVHNVDGVHFEVKRRERIDIPRWFRETFDVAARYKKRPVVAFRSSRSPWLAVVELEYLVELLAERRDHGR